MQFNKVFVLSFDNNVGLNTALTRVLQSQTGCILLQLLLCVIMKQNFFTALNSVFTFIFIATNSKQFTRWYSPISCARDEAVILLGVVVSLTASH